MKTAIITGATSGMGRLMALTIEKNIPNIQEFWLLGRRTDRLEALKDELHTPCRIFTADLQDIHFLNDYEKALDENRPEIVFLVNAAGYGKIGKVKSIGLADQLGMIDLNIRALTGICKLSIPYMSEHSRIINFASGAAFLPQPAFAVYAAGKSYVLSFSRSLNEELHETGCYVTAVCPGPVRTEFFDIAETTGNIPVYKYLFMADPEKVCRLALRDSILKSEISVYGITMKALMIITKLVPIKAILLGMRLANFSGKNNIK
ncbi:hypothetical protein SAMN05216356_101243 [Oribacterium sp. WCC10]|nr:hypothetical protein SAMN05216356_101243 [Oribacterium sp. WCC10]